MIPMPTDNKGGLRHEVYLLRVVTDSSNWRVGPFKVM